MSSIDTSETPDPIVSIDDLTNDINIITSKENLHKRMISTLGTVFKEESTKEALIQWGLRSFSPAFVVAELPIQAPKICSDGVKREISEYLNYISLPYTISDHFMALEACLPGIQVTYSFSPNKTILLHVTRK
jgi:hypothetical protein